MTDDADRTSAGSPGRPSEGRESDRETDLERGREDGRNGGPGRTEAASGDERRERRGPPPNPLYHPLFLPILLVAFSLWFGYDGFLSTDPEMLEHQSFNRVMFFIMLPICLWTVPRGIREFREDQARAARQQQERKSS